MAEFTISLLKSLNYNFLVDEKSTTKEFAAIRTTFRNSDEVKKFFEMKKFFCTRNTKIHKYELSN